MRSVRALILSVTVCAMFLAAPVYAQIPTVMNYQGRLTDADGIPVDDGHHDITFSIYDGPTTPSHLWQEVHSSVFTSTGLFSVLLGNEGQPLSANEFPINQERYLGIAIDSDPEISPRTQLVSMPYAFNCDKLDGYDASELISLGVPGEPVGTFSEFVVAPNDATTDVYTSAGITEITSIVVSGYSLAVFQIQVDGLRTVMVGRVSNVTELNFMWQRGDGAGIVLQDGETLNIVPSSAGVELVVLGFQY